MKILVCGDDRRLEEFRNKLEGEFAIDYCDSDDMPAYEDLEQYDAVIDLNLDEYEGKLDLYAGLKGKIVVGCAVKQSLAEMAFILQDEVECELIGMNGLPGFIGRDLMELSTLGNRNSKAAEKLFGHLGWKYKLVEDRVGMVTPRIIFMIINEAYYTLQEGTATADDIDQSMKLGTNYPLGPFEWCEKTGLEHIYEVLEALYNDTHEERYKICPLLKRKYLTGAAV